MTAERFRTNDPIHNSTARILPSKYFVRFHLPRFTLVRRLLDGRPRLLVATIVVLAVTGFAAAGWLTWFSYDLTNGLPNRDALRGLGDMSQATTLFDAGDRPAFTIFKEQRIEVPLSRVSQNLIKAVVSVEDQRFFEHSGIDAVRVLGAVFRNLQTGRRAEGGSTITQQLARQSFLTRDKTYRRKLKEVILAAHIENLYNKEEILELYLNKVYFGDGLYGVEAASRGYFGRTAADLTVDQAALLAGLIQSPSSYAPTVNLDRAIARRNVVLQTMVASGAIDEATAARAKKARGQADQRPRNQRDLRPLFQGAGSPRAGRALRLAARVSGRPSSVHHAAARDAEGGRGDRRERPRGHREAARLQVPAAREAGHRKGRPA